MTFPSNIDNRLVTGDYLGMNLYEGIISNNSANSGVNVNLIRVRIHQECLIENGNGSQCAIFKDTAHDVFRDTTEY